MGKAEKPVEQNPVVDPFGLREIGTFVRKPGRVFLLNFLAGIGRGLGFAIGFTLLAAIIILFLKKAVAAPVIGRFVSQIIDVIEKQHLLPGR